MNSAIISEAWKWILEAAESVIEDDLNEEDLPESYYDELKTTAFAIIRDPKVFREFL